LQNLQDAWEVGEAISTAKKTKDAKVASMMKRVFRLKCSGLEDLSAVALAKEDEASFDHGLKTDYFVFKPSRCAPVNNLE